MLEQENQLERTRYKRMAGLKSEEGKTFEDAYA